VPQSINYFIYAYTAYICRYRETHALTRLIKKVFKW